jgi:cytochrome bd-type quinol oxidase subunit 1
VQVPIFSSPWLIALCFAPFVLVAVARVLFVWSKKPHYRLLSWHWGAAALLLAMIGAIHGIALGLPPGIDLAEGARQASERASRLFGAALTAVSLGIAGVYAWQLLRCEDDYHARSGFRIGVTLALIGLVAQFLSRHSTVFGVAVVILIGVASLLAVEWLMRRYAREPRWLLGLSVLALPAAAAAIVVLGAEPRSARVAIDDVLATVAPVLLVQLLSKRARVAAIAARLAPIQPPR